MKKFRKGFTLLELLVVIGVMGIMSSMAMIAGQQTTDAARANAIADSLEKAASAMMMYYADNADDIALNGTTAENVVKGAKAYLKSTVDLFDEDNEGTADGAYSITIVNENTPGATWWIAYTFSAADTGIKNIMANKAKRMGLKTTNSSTGLEYGSTAAALTNMVYMQVR